MRASVAFHLALCDGGHRYRAGLSHMQAPERLVEGKHALHARNNRACIACARGVGDPRRAALLIQYRARLQRAIALSHEQANRYDHELRSRNLGLHRASVLGIPQACCHRSHAVQRLRSGHPRCHRDFRHAIVWGIRHEHAVLPWTHHIAVRVSAHKHRASHRAVQKREG